MTDEEAPPGFRVEPGSVDLPILGWSIAIVGLSKMGTILFLDPIAERHDRRFEVWLGQPFVISRGDDPVPVETARDVADQVQALGGHEIEAAIATPDGELTIELTDGLRIIGSTDRWSVTGSDRSAWSPHPTGGVAIWSGSNAPRRIDLDDRLGPDAVAYLRRKRERFEEGPGDVPANAFPGVATSGLVVRAIEVTDEPGVAVTLGSFDVDRGSDADGDDGPSWLEAARFFATLRVDEAATPPDPDVLEAMRSAMTDAISADRDARWIFIRLSAPVDRHLATIAPERLAALLGRSVDSLRSEEDGSLVVRFGEDALASRNWSVRDADGTSWSGADGELTRRDRRSSGLLHVGEVPALAGAWLDHDRTGRDDRFWAWERVNDVVRDQGRAGFALVLALLDGADHDEQVGSIAAGPLEDLLDNHGPDLIADVEREAAANPLLVRALAGVWKTTIDDEVWARIQALLRRPAS